MNRIFYHWAKQKKFLFTLLIINTTSCNNNNDSSKGIYKFTNDIGNGIYAEYYCVFGNGAFGGDMLCVYITDSINFRVKIPNYDESNTGYEFIYKSDSILINKYHTYDTDPNPVMIQSKKHSLKDLEKLKNINDTEPPTINP